MHLRRGLRPALTSVAAAAACLALATPALAADPPGNNGTVKIDEHLVDDGPANNPHVPCTFDVSFYGFDKDQTAKITFNIHPPSGDGTELFSETKTVSDDAAGGRKDEDAVFSYNGEDFGLDRFTRQPQQGYHVKLTIESDGVPGGVKHKVFWLDCAAPAEAAMNTTTTPSAEESAVAAESANPSTTPVAEGGSLPITGPEIGGIVLLGLALAAGGTFIVLRRRRDGVTFVS